ncbi:MAG: CoA transferase [Nocardioides sp.]
MTSTAPTGATTTVGCSRRPTAGSPSRPTEDAQWRSFARAIGRGELAEDPRFASRRARDANGAALTEELVTWSKARSRAEIREVILEATRPGGPFLEMDEVLTDPVLVERDLFVDTAGGLAPGRLLESLGSAAAVLPPWSAHRRAHRRARAARWPAFACWT